MRISVDGHTYTITTEAELVAFLSARKMLLALCRAA